MSEAELDAAVIKATQQALGKFLKKPPLTEKLLRKPPFRYLMDVFNSVRLRLPRSSYNTDHVWVIFRLFPQFIKETGCFEGLYTPEEQLFENISDRWVNSGWGIKNAHKKMPWKTKQLRSYNFYMILLLFLCGCKVYFCFEVERNIHG